MNARIELAKMRLGVLLAPFPFGTRDQFMRWDRMQRAWANPNMNRKGKKRETIQTIPLAINEWGVYDTTYTYTWTTTTNNTYDTDAGTYTLPNARKFQYQVVGY